MVSIPVYLLLSSLLSFLSTVDMLTIVMVMGIPSHPNTYSKMQKLSLGDTCQNGGHGGLSRICSSFDQGLFPVAVSQCPDLGRLGLKQHKRFQLFGFESSYRLFDLF